MYWKKILSYLKEMHVETRQSAHNELLHVVMNKGRYALLTPEAIYSYEDKYDNFAKLFSEYIDFDRIPGRDVLLLGLGLGSVPLLLDNEEEGVWDITAVEIDEEIVDLATTYGIPKIQSTVQVYNTDAAHYVQMCHNQYDMIIVDIFIGTEIPDYFQSKEFLAQLKGLLSSGGIVIYNTIAYTAEDRKLAKAFYEETFHPVFAMSCSVPVHRNLMMVSEHCVLD